MVTHSTCMPRSTPTATVTASSSMTLSSCAFTKSNAIYRSGATRSHVGAWPFTEVTRQPSSSITLVTDKPRSRSVCEACTTRKSGPERFRDQASRRARRPEPGLRGRRYPGRRRRRPLHCQQHKEDPANKRWTAGDRADRLSRTAGDNPQRDSDPAGIRLRRLPAIPPDGVLSTIGWAFWLRHMDTVATTPPPRGPLCRVGQRSSGTRRCRRASHPRGAFLPDIVVPDPRFACRRHTNGNGSHLKFQPKSEHCPRGR